MEKCLGPDQLRSARRSAGLTQQQAAKCLDVSQGYLALIEAGHRRLSPSLQPKIVALYGLGALALPLTSESLDRWDSASLAVALAALGYPGFLPHPETAIHNPAVVLLAAVAAADVEVRVLEALPWLTVQYYALDWAWLVPEVKLRDLQNRLGFIVTLARQVASRRNAVEADEHLHKIETALDRARLAREDSLCQESLSEAERRLLRNTRAPAAAHWNLLTGLQPETLHYAV